MMSPMQVQQLSPTTRRVLRAVAGLLIAVPAGIATLVLYWVGSIEFTGCFFECGDPNPVRGSLFLLGAAITTGLVFASLGWGLGMNGRSRLLAMMAGGFGLVAVYTLILLAFGSA